MLESLCPVIATGAKHSRSGCSLTLIVVYAHLYSCQTISSKVKWMLKVLILVVTLNLATEIGTPVNCLLCDTAIIKLQGKTLC